MPVSCQVVILSWRELGFIVVARIWRTAAFGVLSATYKSEGIE